MIGNSVFQAVDVPSAKTNVFDLLDETSALIRKLLESIQHGLYVTYKYKKFIKNDESTAQLEQRIHMDIKAVIRSELSLLDSDSVHYQTARFYNDGAIIVYFFYLSPIPVSKEGLIEQIEILSENRKKQLINGLLGLHLKSEFIGQAKERFEFPPSFFNSELYISVKASGKEKKDGRAYLEALKPELFVSQTNELVFKLVKKVFKAQRIDGVCADVDDTQVLFKNKERAYRAVSEVSATKYSKRKFMSFGPNYPESINYAQNLISDTLEGLLVRLGIVYSTREFKATHVLDSFIEADKKIQSDIVIIDNTGAEFEKDKNDRVVSQIVSEFKENNPTVTTHTPTLGEMDVNKSYLILNASNAKASGSISSSNTTTVLNTFWDAYRKTRPDLRRSLDYYTQLKIARFEEQGPYVIQGLNIFDGERDALDRKTGESFAVSPHKLNRIRSELWLKSQVFRYSELHDINLPDGKFTLIYIRSLFGRKMNFFASIVDVNIENNNLIITANNIVNSEMRLRLEFAFIGERKVFNDSFYIYDRGENTLLTSYSSDRVPQIIGNTEVDNISLVESEVHTVNRQSGTGISVLPYYLLPKERKQYHHIYLQERGPDLLYFVAPKQRPNQDIAKQNRIYNLLTFDDQGNLLKALEQPVTQMFLSSFTEDILRINEVSKSSLLEKIAKLYIEN
ncbi:MAG: hypothetical protein HRU22_09410 [Gammaproteobacteria bacterium]|nr:hypothetical protein [Gammaproteobacteria bacterium]